MHIKKIVIFVFVLFISFSEQEEIVWSETNRLSWENFKGTPDNSRKAVALTASGISYSLSATVVKKGTVIIDYDVKSFFYPNDSWYKKKRVNKTVLLHEQLHFDITELHARKFRKILSERTFTENVKAEVRKIYKRINNELLLFQKEYDIATNYSIKTKKQLEWTNIVATELLKYKKYQ